MKTKFIELTDDRADEGKLLINLAALMLVFEPGQPGQGSTLVMANGERLPVKESYAHIREQLSILTN
jgi:hypothetical protein